MLRLVLVALVLVFCVGCQSGCESPSAKALTRSETVVAPTKNEAVSPKSTATVLPEEERKKVLQAAEAYMKRQGLKVGEGPGEIVLAAENIWDGRAVVLYGFAASEFFAELGLRKEGREWKVAYDQARYFAFGEEVERPLEVLAAAEGYVFGEEPGKYLVGVKDFTEIRAVLLVAPYGEPWVWEYILEKKKESWVVTAKNKAKEHWEPAA